MQSGGRVWPEVMGPALVDDVTDGRAYILEVSTAVAMLH